MSIAFLLHRSILTVTIFTGQFTYQVLQLRNLVHITSCSLDGVALGWLHVPTVDANHEPLCMDGSNKLVSLESPRRIQSMTRYVYWAMILHLPAST